MNTASSLLVLQPDNTSSPSLTLGLAPKKAQEILEISNCAVLDTFAAAGKNEFFAKDVSLSQVLRGHLRHLPLVPGVVQKGLLYKALGIEKDIYSGKEIIRTSFGKPILPGNKVKLGIGNELLHENDDSALKIEKLDICTPYNEPEYHDGSEKPMTREYLDRILLQCDCFRFVTGASFIQKETDGDTSIGDVFQGYFNIPEDFRFFDADDQGNRSVEPYIIEEMAAQIGVAAFSEKIGKVTNEDNELLDSGSTMTFNSSICKYSGVRLSPGSAFKIVGRVKDISKRTASFEYVGFNDDRKEVIRGEICGNIVSLKILKRMFK